MESATYSLPRMYGDHQVMTIKEALLSIEGVKEVIVSPAAKMVQVRYDPEVVSPRPIEDGLIATGYAPDEDSEPGQWCEAQEDEFPWFKSIWGITQSNTLEREMSGDFRKY